MSDSNIKKTENNQGEKPITPFRCVTGSLVSAVFGFAAYKLMISIVVTYSNKPVNVDNEFALRISSMVRTLVIGVTALATCIFAMVALGLLGLAIKLILEKNKKEESTS